MKPATSKSKSKSTGKGKSPTAASADKKSSSSSAKKSTKSSTKKSGPLAAGPQSKSGKGEVDAKAASEFGKSMAGKGGKGGKAEERDPKKLPTTSISSDLGKMSTAWAAKKGGSTASATISGTKFGGGSAAGVIGKLHAEAAQLEGKGKGQAKSSLQKAEKQAASADGAASAWMAAKIDDTGKVGTHLKSMGAAITAAANAIHDESRGDKVVSVKSHESIADKVVAEMKKPVKGDPKSYNDLHSALKKRAQGLESQHQSALEKVVKIAVELPNAPAQDLKDGDVDIQVTISPNDTVETTEHSLEPDEFDPQAIIGEEGYNKSVARLKAIGARLGLSAGEVEADAKAIWTTAIQTTRSTQSEVAFNKLKPADDPDGRADLDHPTMTLIMNDLDPIIASIEKYMDGIAAQYKEGTWGFWSGKPADPVARENCGMTLEKSPLGTLFDGNKIDGSWHIELWATISRAYAKWAAKDFEKKEFKGFVGRGSSADQSIFNKIEQPTFEMLTAKEKASPKVTFYAVAGQKVKPGDPTNKWLKPDFKQTADGCKGVFKSGDRNAMVAAAEAYNEKVENGIDASAETAGATGAMSELPELAYTNDIDEPHTLKVKKDGDEVIVERHSLKPLPLRGRAFQTVKQINDATAAYLTNKTPEGLKKIKELLATLQKDAEFARGEIDSAGRRKPIVDKRKKFEHLLGQKALRHKAAKDAIGGMAVKAIKMMKALAEPMLSVADTIDSKLLKRDKLRDNKEFQRLVSSCGMPLDSGFGGAIGTEFDDVVKVFQSGGDVSVKLQHVINFGGILADKVFNSKTDDVKKILSKIGVKEAAIKEVVDRKKAVNSKGGPRAGKEAKALFGDMKGNREMQFAKHTEKVDKSGKKVDYEMDTKFPTVPLDALGRDHLELYARKLGLTYTAKTTDAELVKALTIEQKKKIKAAEARGKQSRLTAGAAPGAEGSPMVRSTRKADDADIGLSEGEKAGDGLGDDLAPFVEGVLANLVDEKHAFIKTARRLQMPLKAGISGTTHRFMNQASMMSAPLHGARAGILGHLLKINAHSFHEICTAAKGKIPYKRGEYLPFKPFTDTEMFDIAGKVVSTQEEKNILLNRTE